MIVLDMKIKLRSQLLIYIYKYIYKLYNIYVNGELNDLYSSPNIVRVIKSRRMKCAGHVARMGWGVGGVQGLGGETGGKETTGET